MKVKISALMPSGNVTTWEEHGTIAQLGLSFQKMCQEHFRTKPKLMYQKGFLFVVQPSDKPSWILRKA